MLWLCGFAFLAGFIDSVVGGGGLIQLPALLLLLPPEQAALVPAVLGTNKLSSICGTGMALAQYAPRIAIPWRSMLPAAIAALALSLAGARTVSILSPALLKPLVLVLLVAVSIFTFVQKDLGRQHAPRFTARHEAWIGLLIGSVIGFYDGFFGPGTGSFLIFIFVGLLGFDFLTASASAKVINFATNLSAVAYFAATNQILYAYAVPMGVCNLAGSIAGTQMAMWKGNRFVRWFFLLVVSALIARYGWEVVFP
jgi:uncharacterized protein